MTNVIFTVRTLADPGRQDRDQLFERKMWLSRHPKFDSDETLVIEDRPVTVKGTLRMLSGITDHTYHVALVDIYAVEGDLIAEGWTRVY